VQLTNACLTMDAKFYAGSPAIDELSRHAAFGILSSPPPVAGGARPTLPRPG
jgi:hypothetical protein